MGRFGVGLRERTRVGEVDRGTLKSADGEEIPASVVVWATGFAVPDLALRSGLATDGRDRVLVDASLRSVSHPNVFAAGDSSSRRSLWGPERCVPAPTPPPSWVPRREATSPGT